MKQKFRRLLSALLAIVMVISGLQFGGWTQEAKAATTAGRTIYFDVNGSTNFYSDGAVPAVLFKNGTGIGADVGDWAEMTYVKTDIYSAVIPEGATYVQFRRSNDTNSGSSVIELKDLVNYYKIKDTGWNSGNWENDLDWLNQTEIVTPADYVTINLAYPGNDKPTVCFIKDGNFVRKYERISSFKFDLNSADYNGFYVGWDESAGNQTVQIGLDEIRANIAGKTKVQLTIGDWNGGNNRTHEWSEAAFLGDQSLNIPTAPFTKERDSYYVSTTFYDYYSDVELEGTNRKDLGVDDFVNDPGGSERKIQARQFNEAISEYFRNKLSGNYKPLYFGEFTDVHQTTGSQNYVKSLYEFEYLYNNAHLYDKPDNRMGAHQGLIDTTLNSDNNATMNNIELPYFNEDFLRGENSKNVAVGKVFNGVQFPFTKNAEDYWEFDSADPNQALRMQYDNALGTYYLKRSGVEIKGKTSGGTATTGFFPFNDADESAKTNKLNYAFGVRFDIPFTMTADGQYGDGENKKDIVYNFSGDDDVWVFVDGNLVLDIGGSHSAVDGSINFKTGEVKVSGEIKNFSTGNGYYNQVETSNFIKNLSTNKPHTLTMFYMERGLWESNMKITFNFPRVNTFAVNMEVDTSGVNDIFKSALEDVNLSTFDVRVQNYATRGTDKSGANVTESSKTYNTLNQGTESTVTYQGSPEQSGIQTDTSNKSGKENVLLVKYKAQLKNTPDANGHRVNIKPEQGEPFDASDVSDYLQFDMYNEGMGSTGVPYVYLKDASGKEISGWANNSIAYDGNNNTLTRNKWVTVKVDLQKLKGNSEFDFSKITEIGIGYWDSGYTYIDDITFHKKVTVDTPQVVFQTPQYDVPTYGSITANKLKNATGAIYAQKKQDDTDSKSYVIGSDGTITLSDGDTALFTDQFRIGSYIGLNESVNPDYYTTTWTLAEGKKEYLKGTGAVIKDERTEQNGYAADNDENGNPMSLNDGVRKPEDSFLYRSPSRTDDIITPTNIEATFINKINVGSLSVQKAVEGDLTGSYTFTITFSNIFGQIDKTVTKDIVIPAGEIYTFEGIPVGTHYVIKETGLDSKEYSVTNVVHSTGNDAGSADVANSQYIGDLSLGANNITDIITITNAPKPEEVTTVFYVESGTDTTLPLGLNELKYYDNTAKPESTEEADVYLNQDEEGFKFDVPHDGEPSKSVPNEKYTFTYSGTRTDGKSVKGTATVYTFKANNDIYVFDYGLKSDLADISHGSGLFENDVLFSQKVDGTTAAFTGLKRNATDSVAATVTNEQSTITADAVPLPLTKLSDPSLGAKLTDTNAKVTFQPTAFMDKVETFYYQASVYASDKTSITSAADGVNLSASVKVMPASVVYYEDNFNATNTTANGKLKIIYTNSAAAPKKDPTASQSNDQNENYGHDAAYNTALEASGGSSTVLTNGDGAYFTFTGTGFDIISRTNSNTAGLIAYVFKGVKSGLTSATVGKEANRVKAITVDTFYRNGDLYQVPVISTTLDYDTYTVYLRAAATYTGQNTIYIDGIRIYQPLGTDVEKLGDYLKTEQAPTVEELRGLFTKGTIDLVQEDNAKIETGGSTVIELYANEAEPETVPGKGDYKQVSAKQLKAVITSGPNNELYVPLGNGIAFSVPAPSSDDWTLQIGAKSVSPDNGNAKQFTVWVKPDTSDVSEFVEWKTYEINTSTDMYYDLDFRELIKTQNWTADQYAVAIVNPVTEYDTYDIISLTNVKHSGSLSKIQEVSQTTTSNKPPLTAAKPVIQSAKFDVTSVTRGKYTDMVVITDRDVTDVKVYDPNGYEVTSFNKKNFSVDANSKKVWKLTFKVIKTKGKASYTIKAVVDGEIQESETSASITIR